jgi:lactam utilization protein B
MLYLAEITIDRAYTDDGATTLIRVVNAPSEDESREKCLKYVQETVVSWFDRFKINVAIHQVIE